MTNASEARRSPQRYRQAAIYSLLYLAIACIGHLVLPRAHLDSPVAAVVLAGGLLLAFLGVVLGLILALIRLDWGPWWQGCGTVAATGLMLGARKLGLQPVGDYLIVVAASLFGGLVARLVRERNLLLPVAVVAGVVDFWGVYWGFVAHISQTAPKVVEQFSSAVPTPRGVTLPVPVMSAMGIGDFLFTAIFLGVVVRLGLHVTRTLLGVFLAVLLAPVVLWVVPLFTGKPLDALPGLPFIGLGVIAANWREFSLTREEKFALLWALVAVGGLIGVYLLLGLVW